MCPKEWLYLGENVKFFGDLPGNSPVRIRGDGCVDLQQVSCCTDVLHVRILPGFVRGFPEM